MKTWRFIVPTFVLVLSMVLPSATGWAQAPPALPGQVMNLDAHSYSMAALLTWNAPAGPTPTGYRVTTYQQVGGTYQVVPAARVTFNLPTLATVSGLSPTETYNFRVTPLYGTLTGVESNLSRSIVPGAGGPPKPLNVQGTVRAGTVTLTWAYPSNTPIDHYLLLMYQSGGGMVRYQDPAGTYQNGGPNSTTVSGLPSGTYLMELRTIGSDGMMSVGVQVQVTVQPTPTVRAPDRVTDVRAVFSNGQFTVSWLPAYDGGSPIGAYSVMSTTDPNGGPPLAIIRPSESPGLFSGGRWTAAIDTHNITVTYGKSYTFYVFAVNAVGVSQPAVSNTITVATVPGAVRNLSVTPGDTSAVVKWDAPASDGGSVISGYEVMASDGTHTATVTQTQTTSVTLTGLSSGTTYTISVVAVNALGRSSAASVSSSLQNLAPTLTVPGSQTVQYSDKVSFEVSATGPEASDHLVLTAIGLPAGLSFADKGNGTGTVTGAVAAEAGTYTVTFSVNDGHNQAVSRTVGIVVTHEDAIVQPNPSMPIAVTVTKGKNVAQIVNVGAFIQEAADGSPGGFAKAVPVTVTLKAMGSGSTITRTASIQTNGRDRLLASATFKNLTPNVYRVFIQVGGNYYRGVGHSIITVANPAQRGSVRGQGTVSSHGNSATVQFQVKHLANGKLQGSLTYIERRATGTYTLKGTVTGDVVIQGHKAFFQGKGTLNGAGAYRFAVAIMDNARWSGIDKVALWVIGPNHTLVDDCTFSATAVSGGDTVVSVR